MRITTSILKCVHDGKAIAMICEVGDSTVKHMKHKIEILGVSIDLGNNMRKNFIPLSVNLTIVVQAKTTIDKVKVAIA